MATDFSKYGVNNANPQAPAQSPFSKYGTPVTQVLEKGEKVENTYGAVNPATGKEKPIEAGLKAATNLPSSAFNLAKGLFSAITHPKQTITGIADTAIGGVQKLIPGEQNKEEQFNQFVGFLKERYGSLENLQKTAINDPFGLGTDILTLMQGGAAITGRTATLNQGLSTVARTVTKPVSEVTSTIGNTINKTTRFGVSQATGLDPDTIGNIVRSPEEFSRSAINNANRETLAGVVKESIDNRLDALRDTGSGYESIKQIPLEQAPVRIDTSGINKVFKNYGLEVVDGKIKITSESRPISSADKAALEDFLSVYGDETVLSPNAFLNAREKLAQIAKYDSAKTPISADIARDLRAFYNETGRPQIPGLEKLDLEYAPEVQLLNQIKRDYLKPDGTFKDGAVNKIANLTGKGKEQVLTRLEQIQPGVTQRIKILKAAEDIERASGVKVGTYARSAVAGGGLLTGNPGLIVAAIISQPEIAVRLLRGYGYTKKNVGPIIRALYQAGNDVNNFRLPGNPSDYIQEYLSRNKNTVSN